MTAPSGDALSHVDFQVRSTVVLRQMRAPEFGPAPNGGLHASPSAALVPIVFAWRL
jgi:hypothetical protein